MKEVKAIKNFFRNGEMIKKDEIVEVDNEAYKQLVEEEGLCVLIRNSEGEENGKI